MRYAVSFMDYWKWFILIYLVFILCETAGEFFSFVKAVFFSTESVIYKCIYLPYSLIVRLMIKNETSTTTYYQGTKQYHEKRQ